MSGRTYSYSHLGSESKIDQYTVFKASCAVARCPVSNPNWQVQTASYESWLASKVKGDFWKQVREQMTGIVLDTTKPLTIHPSLSRDTCFVVSGIEDNIEWYAVLFVNKDQKIDCCCYSSDKNCLRPLVKFFVKWVKFGDYDMAAVLKHLSNLRKSYEWAICADVGYISTEETRHLLDIKRRGL